MLEIKEYIQINNSTLPYLQQEQQYQSFLQSIVGLRPQISGGFQ